MGGRRLNAFALVRLLSALALLASLSAQPAAAWVISESNACASRGDGDCESSRSEPQVAVCAFGKGIYFMGDVSTSGAVTEWGRNDNCADPSQHDRVSAGFCGGFDGSDVYADFDSSDGNLMLYFPFVGRDSDTPGSGYGPGTQSAGTCN